MKHRNVMKAIAMISQIGLGMIVPIFLCVYAGVFLRDKFDKEYLFLIFLLLGILAAIRNLFTLTSSFYKKDKEKEDKELAYFESLKRKRGDK